MLMEPEDVPSWEELLPRMDSHDAILVAGMLAWNNWVDKLIDGDDAVRA